jgi:hypothetical protein
MLPKVVITLVALWACAAGATAQDVAAELKAVTVVAPQRIAVPVAGGAAQLAAYLTADMATPQPQITRAVITFHGILRNADVYHAGAVEARSAAGGDAATTLLVTPQFLTDYDAASFGLPADVLTWHRDSWSGGTDAIGQYKVSSFAAIDAILTLLADRSTFPNLAHVVIAGHSGGGQIVHRYAVVGNGETALASLGIKTRYIVANPSSYVSFTANRPGPDGRYGPFAAAASCPRFNEWKYGFAGNLPAYVNQTAAVYEARYVTRDVVHLLGAKDVDPNHRVLDKSCMGEALGPNRFQRGHWFYAHMKARAGEKFGHRLHDIPGVGHDGTKMFNSACGLAALYDRPGCAP